jgi:hypothetical protein
MLLLCLLLRVFVMLPPHRYAGRSFETVAAVEAGSGSLLVKGVRAVWRQSAPYIQHTLMVRSAATAACTIGKGQLCVAGVGSDLLASVHGWCQGAGERHCQLPCN